jgi:hypothetical protein
MGNRIYFKIAGYVDLDMLHIFAIKLNIPTTQFWSKSHTYFGVFALFSSKCSKFQYFHLISQTLLEIEVKFKQNCMVGRSWHTEHDCCLNLTSISYSFWNNGQKVFKKLYFFPILGGGGLRAPGAPPPGFAPENIIE